MSLPHNIKVLEVCQASPLPGSIADTSLPLTFFDVVWLRVPPVQRLFFYQFRKEQQPNNSANITNTAHFLDTILPKLKRSLSLTLRLFYPLAGNLILFPQTGNQEICYAEGDSVQLTVVESDADFHRLIADQPKDVSQSHPLVPQLPSPLNSGDTLKQPLLALQLTLFPNAAGICIGTSTHHAVADGSSFMHFMKSWALICGSGGGDESSSLINTSCCPPSYDRSVFSDFEHIKTLILEQMASTRVEEHLEQFTSRHKKVRATFVLKRSDIERLRQRVVEKDGPKKPSFHCSAFVVTCAYVWVCLTKAQQAVDDSVEGKKMHFSFAVDGRRRLEPPIPATYFGNCLSTCLAEMKGRDLVGEDGVVSASEAIGRALSALLADGLLKDIVTLLPRFWSILGERIVSVAGSPKFRVYDTDFGWGRPEKVEVISIEATGAISLAENRKEEGGIEVGLALPISEMEIFASLFQEGLKLQAV